MKWASAISTAASLREAVVATSDEIRRQLAGDKSDLTLFFVSPYFPSAYEDLPALLQEHLPSGVLVGCTAEGVIGGGKEIEHERALSVVSAALPGVRIRTFFSDTANLPDADAPPGAWSEYLGIGAFTAGHFILLADPFSVAAEALLAGMDYAFPQSRKIGGLASGGVKPLENILYLDAQMQRHGLVGVALSGNVEVDTLVAQGCRPIGDPLAVTRCEQQLLCEVDHRRPLEYLQTLAQRLTDADRQLLRTSLFLGVEMPAAATPSGDPRYLIRNLVGVDFQTGAIAVGALLHEGQAVQFHLRDRVTSAEDLDRLVARYAARGSGAGARGALLFSCLGRGAYLYGEPDHDSRVFSRSVGAIPLGGFFCNGEIGPVGAATCLHGYTSAFGIFRPAGAAT